ncbi:hypothetical protein K458DRAFT_4850 [Lentithecium fluviatile CBS 122367]|uniref:Uncharacterized protein n=1 Tax=Lentithecium fluviatile CBS 122367 TaxID=1168545 RepID=A0A6G1JMD5_9PLEO|nr:hypothetical protein K458DRAFT_4850 [Lentithecium fluviatile CBS 122367]
MQSLILNPTCVSARSPLIALTTSSHTNTSTHCAGRGRQPSRTHAHVSTAPARKNRCQSDLRHGRQDPAWVKGGGRDFRVVSPPRAAIRRRHRLCATSIVWRFVLMILSDIQYARHLARPSGSLSLHRPAPGMLVQATFSLSALYAAVEGSWKDGRRKPECSIRLDSMSLEPGWDVYPRSGHPSAMIGVARGNGKWHVCAKLGAGSRS